MMLDELYSPQVLIRQRLRIAWKTVVCGNSFIQVLLNEIHCHAYFMQCDNVWDDI